MEKTVKHMVLFALAIALLTGGTSSYVLAQSYSDKNVRVVHVSRADLSGSSGKILPTITRGVQETAQQELNANGALKSFLQNRNVQVNNVVKIGTAANGDTIVYVK